MIEFLKSKIDRLRPAGDGSEAGFTYIDVMMAIGIMTIGSLGLIMTMTTAMVTTTQSQQQAVAKQFATSTMESIFSARDINNSAITSNGLLNFSAIANVSNGGIFLDGFNPVYVVNTNTAGQIVPASGADGIMGTADDSTSTGSPVTAYQDYQRKIVITNISNNNNGTINLLKIVVTIQYKMNNLTLQQSMTSYLADYNTQSV